MPSGNSVMFYFGFIMSALYVVVGLLLVFTHYLPGLAQAEMRNIIGAVLVLYGSFRLVRLIQNLKRSKNE